MEQALATGPQAPTAERTWVLGMAGLLAHRLGDDDAAVVLMEQAAEMARGLGLPRYEAVALIVRGIVDEDRGDYDEAEPRFAAARDLLRQIGCDWEAANSDLPSGHRRLWSGATRTGSGALGAGRGRGAGARRLVVVAWCLRYLGLLAIEQGDLRRAADVLRERAALERTVALRGDQGDVARDTRRPRQRVRQARSRGAVARGGRGNRGARLAGRSAGAAGLRAHRGSTCGRSWARQGMPRRGRKAGASAQKTWMPRWPRSWMPPRRPISPAGVQRRDGRLASPTTVCGTRHERRICCSDRC